MADFPNYPNPGFPSNNRDRMSITTSLFTLWDEAGNQLRIACLDNGLSVAIWVPFHSQDGRRTYPQEQRYSTICVPKCVIALENIIYEDIVPAYQQGRNLKKGVYTNNAHTNMLEVEVREGDFYFNFHRNCDPMTRIPQITISFKFDVYQIVSAFDPYSGEIQYEPIQADFFIFAKAIRAFTDLAGGMIGGHGNRVASSRMSEQLMSYIKAIAMQVHAQLPAPQGYNQGLPAPGIITPSQRPTPQQEASIPEPPIKEIDDISDLM